MPHTDTTVRFTKPNWNIFLNIGNIHLSKSFQSTFIQFDITKFLGQNYGFSLK